MAVRKTAIQKAGEKDFGSEQELEKLRAMAAEEAEHEEEEKEEETVEEAPKQKLSAHPEAVDEVDVPVGYAHVRGVTPEGMVALYDDGVLLMSGETAVVRKTFGFRRAVETGRIEVL